MALLFLALPVQAADELDKARELLAAHQYRAAVIELKNRLQRDPGDSTARLLLGDAYLEMQSGAAAEKEFRRAAELGVHPAVWRLKLADALLLQRKFSDMLDLIDEAGVSGDAKGDSELAARRGRALSGLDRPVEAAAAYERALRLDPANEQAALGRVLLAAQGEDRDAAAAAVDEFLATYPDNADVLLMRAEMYRREGDLDRAGEFFSRAVEQKPEDVRGLLGHATVMIGLKDLSAAEADLDLVDEIRKDLPMAHYLRGLIAYQERDWESAKSYLEGVLRATPGHVQSQLLLGVISFSAKDYQIAEEYLSHAVSAMPNNLNAVKILGATHIKMREPKRAIELLQPIVLNNPDAQLMALLGSAYMLDGNEDEGQEWLSRAVEVSPDVAALRTQLALTLLADGQTDGAIDELKTAVDLGQDVVQADVLLVLAHVKKEQYEQALEASLALEQRLPEQPLPYNLTGLVYLAQKDLESAEQRFNKALEKDPEFATASLNLARIDVARNDLDGAAKRYEAVLAKQATHLQSMLGLAAIAERRGDEEGLVRWLERAQDANRASIQPALILARHHMAKGDTLRAVSVATDLSNRYPGNPQVLELLARAQILAGENLNAERSLERLSDMKPDSYFLHHLLGGVKWKGGNLDGARREFERALSMKPDFLESRVALASMLISEKRFDEAQEMAAQLTKDFPDSDAGPRLEGTVHLAQDRPGQAATAYETAFALKKTSDTAASLARAYADDNRRPAAIELLEGWTEDHADDARAWLLLAQYRQLEGRDAEAARAYEALTAAGHKNVVILNNLAWIYLQLGDERAVEVAREAYDLEPQRPEVADTYGWALVQSGKAREGLTILQQAYVSYPTQAEIGYHVAVGLNAEGRDAEAVKILRRILRESPGFGQAEEAKALLAELEK